MKKEKLIALRSILFSVALSQAALTGCSSTMTAEQIGISIEEHSDNFKKDAGLYKDENGKWDVYYHTRGNYYNFKTHEILKDPQFTMEYEDGHHIYYDELFNGYLPFFRCNPNVTYTKNVIENLSTKDIEALKDDFLARNTFKARDIKLFRLEKIDKSSSKTVIGVLASETEIFNLETWQVENYEGYSIVKEKCNFNKLYVSVSDVLDYLHNLDQEEKEIPNPVEKIEEETKETIEETKEKIEEETKNYELKHDDEKSYSIDLNEECTAKDIEDIITYLDKNSKMTHLSLSGNSKEIPEKILKKISELKNLTNIYLFNIQNLDLSFTSSLNLHGILIDGCTVRNVEALEDLKELEYFTAYYCNIDDVKPLSQIQSLVGLTLIEADPSKELKSLESLENLKQLVVLRLYQYQINDLSFLKNMDQLSFLSIETHNTLDIEPIINLNHLRSVDFETTNIQNINVLTELDRTKGTPLEVSLSPNSNLSELEPYIQQFKEKNIEICIQDELQEIPLEDYLNQKENHSLNLQLP